MLALGSARTAAGSVGGNALGLAGNVAGRHRNSSPTQSEHSFSNWPLSSAQGNVHHGWQSDRARPRSAATQGHSHRVALTCPGQHPRFPTTIVPTGVMTRNRGPTTTLSNGVCANTHNGSELKRPKSHETHYSITYVQIEGSPIITKTLDANIRDPPARSPSIQTT